MTGPSAAQSPLAAVPMTDTAARVEASAVSAVNVALVLGLVLGVGLIRPGYGLPS